jgi:hypothetical protein
MASGITDTSGNVGLSVPSGTGSLEASASGYHTFTETITAVEGALFTVDLTKGGVTDITWILIVLAAVAMLLVVGGARRK